MKHPPNLLQKAIHRIAMLPPVTAFFATRMHHMDLAVLKWSSGRYTFSEIFGWPIIFLTTTGAKTGRRLTQPLIGIFDGERIALIASSFGRTHNPGWYYNLKAHPQCEVQFRGRTSTYLAREAAGPEREALWQLALTYYQGYDAYKERASHRVIPVMILEPMK